MCFARDPALNLTGKFALPGKLPLWQVVQQLNALLASVAK